MAPTLYEAGDDITAWVRAALDAVGDGPLVVVGNSVGGSCAIEVARLAPGKVKALVLCGAKAGHRPEPDLRDEALRVLEEEGLGAAWERYWRPLFGPDVPAAVIDQAWSSAEHQGPASIAAGVRAFHGRPDREAFLRSWHGPVVFVSGEHDSKPPPSRRAAEQLSHGSFHPVTGIGPLRAAGGPRCSDRHHRSHHCSPRLTTPSLRPTGAATSAHVACMPRAIASCDPGRGSTTDTREQVRCGRTR